MDVEAKHLAASDLSALRTKLGNPGKFWVREVISGSAGDAVAVYSGV